jgi:hypothetical protein
LHLDDHLTNLGFLHALAVLKDVVLAVSEWKTLAMSAIVVRPP